jgi:hypothetical protein
LKQHPFFATVIWENLRNINVPYVSLAQQRKNRDAKASLSQIETGRQTVLVEKVAESKCLSPIGFGGMHKRSMNDMMQAGFSPLITKQGSANSFFISNTSGPMLESDSSANSSFIDLVTN